MTKQFQLKIFLILLILLILDLIAIKFTTVPATSPMMQHHLEKVLKTPIQMIDRVAYDNKQYLTYLNDRTHHLDLAIYHPNQILQHRYNLEEIYEVSPNALISGCQYYQTSSTLVVWGKNKNLSAKILLVTIGNEVFIKNLSNSPYFLTVYPNEKLNNFSIEFLDSNDHNITPDFFNVKIPY